MRTPLFGGVGQLYNLTHRAKGGAFTHTEHRSLRTEICLHDPGLDKGSLSINSQKQREIHRNENQNHSGNALTPGGELRRKHKG